uniref:hypothetical protein n=1 Tax=Okeania sp. SIO2F4 TaxID=2607790 RepID=UPI00341EFC4F
MFCKELAGEFPVAQKLNSMARQASVERAWNSISSFYRSSREGIRSSKNILAQLSIRLPTGNCQKIASVLISPMDLRQASFLHSVFCNHETREDLFRLKINRVRVVRRADGYYAQLCLDANRKETRNYTGNVVGIDLGLKYFYKDQSERV